MSNKVIQNKRGETFVVVNDISEGRFYRSPESSRDYDTLKERFAARLSAEASLGHGGAERQLDKKTIERVYDEFLRDDVEPLARPDLEEMAQEIYRETRAGYHSGERTEGGAIAAVAETFGRAIEQRTTRERLTENMLEDIYKKVHRTFLENGAYQLIPELQTIYLGALVKLRTRSHTADLDTYETAYGVHTAAQEDVIATYKAAFDAYSGDWDQFHEEQRTLLEAAERAELPKVAKPKKEEEKPAEKEDTILARVRRLHAAHDELAFFHERIQERVSQAASLLPLIESISRKELADLLEGIQGRAALAPLYFTQATRELKKTDSTVVEPILSLYENMVRTIARDLDRFDAFLQAAPQILPRDMMRELLPRRRELLAQWNQLFERLKAQKGMIDTAIRTSSESDTQMVAKRLDERVRVMLKHIADLKKLDDEILTQIVETETASADHVKQYGDLLASMDNFIRQIHADADALGI